MPNKAVLLVSSCDYFSDCWEPFIHSFIKYWPDCKWPMYIISNNNDIPCPNGIQFIKVGEDKLFASNLKNAIKQIDSEYIIYLQEDYFLNMMVNNDAIEKHISYCIDHNIDYLRLGPPYLNGHIIDNIYIQNSLRQKYALCLQAAIWKKDSLEKLLIEGWSGWDFEYRIQDYAIKNGIDLNILSLRNNTKNIGINYVTGTAVRKGKWTLSGYKFLANEGFSDLLSRRKVEGYIFFHLQEANGLFKLPCRILVKLMKIMNWNF